MKYQEQFPTIWDTPTKPANTQATKKPLPSRNPRLLKRLF